MIAPAAREHAPLAPVFLVGCPRSGTTLLQRLVDAHSQVAIAPETHFMRRFWVKRDAYGDLADEAAFDRLLGDITAMPEFSDMRLDAAAFAAAARDTDRSYAALFGLLLQLFRDRRGASIVGEKTPNHLLHMQTLEVFFPGARFIHIIRDPRAVVCSWRSVPWSNGSLAADAAVWRRYIRTAWDRPPARHRLHTVRYEALTRHPGREVRAICDFLGIPLEPDMLRFHERESETLDLAREPWKRAAAAPIDRSAADEWRRALSRDEIAEIEQIALPEMLWLGYRPVARPARLVVKTAARLGAKGALGALGALRALGAWVR